jgi:hypothetical protein
MAAPEVTAPVVAAAAVDLMGPGIRLTFPAFEEDVCLTAGTLGLFLPRPVPFKAIVLIVGLDTGRTVVVATEADTEVRLVIVLGLVADEAAEGVRLIAMGLGMGAAFGTTPMPCVLVAFVIARAFKDILLETAERTLDAADCFCLVIVS